MTSLIETNLLNAGLSLPTPPNPVAAYVPFTIHDSLVFISGQVPFQNGKIIYTGKVGEDVSVQDAQLAAQVCTLNVLAQLKAACQGDLNRARKCLKIGGFVNCSPTFTQHPIVLNGASETIITAMGDNGKHARFAVGAPSLPLNAAVEVDAVFAVNPS